MALLQQLLHIHYLQVKHQWRVPIDGLSSFDAHFIQFIMPINEVIILA